MRPGLVAALRARIQRRRRSDVDQPTPAALANELDVLRAQLEHLTVGLHAVELQRSPMLWNEVVPTLQSLGTIAEVVGAVAAERSDRSAVLQTSIARFAKCAQGPPLTAISPRELQALVAGDLLPVPPPAARERYFEGDDVSYWTSGLGDRLLLEDLGRQLERPLTAASRLLDFGSSSGRVLRHFANATPQMRALGVDLGRHNVEWARQYLHPAVSVAQGTTIPHLPFPDGSFDCIYGGSVFTHIADFEESWLLELSRVLAPNGFAMLTFHPERMWIEIGSDPDHWFRQLIDGTPHRLDPGAIQPVGGDVFERPMPAGRAVLTASTRPVNNANVFHSHRWIRRRWGDVFKLEFILERAHAEYQDAAILTSRRSSRTLQ
jgi:SAM-dependent methyltransferase